MSDRYFTQLESPVGLLTLTATSEGLTGLHFDRDRRSQRAADFTRSDAPFAGVILQLREYFEGRRTSFQLELAPEGTPFQRRVWAALRDIPFGHTLSYGELARGIGVPAASRAVGAPNGQNPIGIIVPCHRVIGKSGALTGFAGGIPRKQFLLEHESRHPALFGQKSLPMALREFRPVPARTSLC